MNILLQMDEETYITMVCALFNSQNYKYIELDKIATKNVSQKM